ncbi:MAG TPA: DMT family transporter [Polyangiaceae bacterium]|nr:DMT family transporter [Polyangiaceae bacterium]
MTLGTVAAFVASVTWAFATTRYARASREVGSTRVNLARTFTALPAFAILRVVFGEGPLFAGFTTERALWLLASIVCSYAVADSLFLAACRRVGITTGLSIASTYPLWAAIWGTVVDGEAFGTERAAGTLLAVGGVIWLVRLGTRGESARERDGVGLGLAVLVSVLWALNSIGVKRGATGIGLFDVNVFRFSAALLILAPQLRLPSERGRARAPTGGWVTLVPALLADCTLGSLAYVYGLSHTDLAVGATLSSLAPLISVPFAVAAGEERFDVRRLAAIVTTVLGVALLVR